MIRIALVWKIGSGKTFISKLFGYPVFNADVVVSEIYNKDKKTYNKLKKKLPNFFFDFPIKKKELIKAILRNKENIKIISSIIHPVVRKKLNIFLKKNKKKTIVILDIPLFLENKLNKKNDYIIYVQAKQKDINKKLKLRKNYNKKILKKLKNLQYSSSRKKTKSNYVIKNNFNKKSARKLVKNVLNKVLSWKRLY